ncbi:hypothetical protein KA093_03425 [Candidatus Saccharibacteria bacterium]|nr:hypothetical protein [Candidatus Saccharibacteria bacterium]
MYKVHYRHDRGLKGRGRASAVRKLKRTTVGVLILVGLLILAGIIYTWLMGLRRPKTATPQVETSRAPTVRRPAPTDPNAAVGVYIQSLTSEVVPGTNASLAVRSQPEADCVVKITYQNIPSNDSGLVTKRADDYGMVRWSWTVEPTAPLGKGSADITCTRNKRSGYMHGDMMVVKELSPENQ